MNKKTLFVCHLLCLGGLVGVGNRPITEKRVGNKLDG